jgi:hypothetical protein
MPNLDLVGVGEGGRVSSWRERKRILRIVDAIWFASCGFRELVIKWLFLDSATDHPPQSPTSETLAVSSTPPHLRTHWWRALVSLYAYARKAKFLLARYRKIAT